MVLELEKPSGAFFVPNPDQEQIFNFVTGSSRNGIVKGGPGTGKTKTLSEIAAMINGQRAAFVAFNNHIARELKEKIEERLGGAKSTIFVQTLHSMGKYCLKRKFGVNDMPLREHKYREICEKLYGRYGWEADREELKHLEKLIEKVRITLASTDSESLLATAMRFNIEFDLDDDKAWERVCKVVPEALQLGIVVCTKQHLIDFTDMIWLPLQYKYFVKYAFILVDEAQDMSAAAQKMILSSLQTGGRTIAVGDEDQAINVFAGGDPYSMVRFKEQTDAVVLPLMYCYRCPRKHIDLANSVYGGLKPVESTIEGSIWYMQYEDMYRRLQPGEAIMCRLTRPLVDTCMNLFKRGIKAKVKGRDLGASFVDMIDHIHKKYNCGLDDFEEALSDYQDRQCEALSKIKDNEMAVDALFDRVATVKVFFESYIEQYPRGDFEGFKGFVIDFFADNADRGVVWLLTVHRSKGSEFKNTYIIEPQLMPSSRAVTEEDIRAEMNCYYVAVTRAKDTLSFVYEMMPPHLEAEYKKYLNHERGIVDEAPVTPTAAVVEAEAIITQPAVIEAPAEPVVVEEVVTRRGRRLTNAAIKKERMDLSFPSALAEVVKHLTGTEDEAAVKGTAREKRSSLLIKALLNLPEVAEALQPADRILIEEVLAAAES